MRKRSRIDKEGQPSHEAFFSILHSISSLGETYLAALYLTLRRVYSVSMPEYTLALKPS